MTSLTSLGYICEEINPRDLNDSTKNNVILALINNLSSDQNEESIKLCEMAIKALVHTIPYASQNFMV